jgi:competence protein ComEA
MNHLHDLLPSWPRRRLLGVAALIVAVLVLATRFVLPAGSARERIPRPVSPRPARAAPLVVHVVGAVRRAGLYQFRQGARIADAVTRAGGPTRRADLTAVNLAAPLADGVQVVVPVRQRGAPAAAAAAGSGSGPVHLNTATLEQLDALPGVGPVTAQKILDFRQSHGAFGSVDDLDAVPGIGPGRLEQLRELVAP